MMAMEWLVDRWPGLLRDIAEYDTYEEGAEVGIQAICEAELAVWKTYCQQSEVPLFQQMMIEARNYLRYHLPAPWSEWYNSETGDWEHIGLKYLNCTEEEWEQLREHVLDQRLLLCDPKVLVSRASALLTSGLREDDAWPTLVVGIAVLTGRDLLQILKHGYFSGKTSFSLLFRDTVYFHPLFPDPFEIPTLERASLVLEAWERVRALIDCSLLNEYELLQEYGQVVKEAAEAYFGDLIPLRLGKKNLLSTISRSVYPCLATYYYCPPSLDEVTYIAAITCRPLALLPSSPGEGFAEAAIIHHAFEYVVADEHGSIDERKSLWLDRDDVKIVEALQRPEDVGRYADHEVIEVIFEGDALQSFEDLRCQIGYGLCADKEGKEGQADGEETTRSGSLELFVSFRNHGVSPSLYAFIQAGLKHLSKDLVESMHTSLQDELLSGLKLQQPFNRMFTSDLRGCTHPQAIGELVRRSIVTLMRRNQAYSDFEPTRCWYINEEVIFQLIQQDRSAIRWWLEEEYQQEIDQHHHEFHLTEVCNAKARAVTEDIYLSEYPSAFR